jgi:prepilin-type N-terminal cleavage/methylation domain-containing protein
MRSIGQKGFTLIELMVVIVIIGVLVAIALPNFIGAQDRAKIAGVKANARTLQVVVETYAVDWGGTYPSTISAITSTEGYKTFSNPYTGLPGVANTNSEGAWRTNDEGGTEFADSSLLNFSSENGRPPVGVVMYVGLDTAGESTTLYLSADGGNANTQTSGYIIYGCDSRGRAIRRFVISNGVLTPAAQRLRQGS